MKSPRKNFYTSCFRYVHIYVGYFQDKLKIKHKAIMPFHAYTYMHIVIFYFSKENFGQANSFNLQKYSLKFVR